jgi:Ca2+-transporting ATPase
MNTQIGKVIKVLLEHKDENSFFGKAITRTLNKVSLIAIAVSVIALALAVLKKSDIQEIGNTLTYILMSFNFSIFIIIISLFFSIVFAKFKKKNIFIKNISTILLLSNISAIFLKKIGAISESKLVFREVYCDGTLLDIQSESIKLEDTMERIISIALLCNDARLSSEGQLCVEDTNSIENLAEGAILKFCRERFVEISELESKHRRLFKISYDSHKRIKTVVNEVEGRYRANVAGVLDSLLNKCTHILINGVEKEIKDTDIQNIINVHIAMSNKDYSVVAFGYRNFNYEPSVHENIESNLVFVGLMGFENPIKESSYEAMKTCRHNNIRLIVDEVDNKLASFAFGKRMGITKKKEAILSGIEMDHMSKEEFEKNIGRISIFSKISPKHKSEIVNALNSKGYSIASVGDTLIDLEYLSSSHIAISVGAECSNIVKKLSSLFLKENDFGEIINLIVDSKKIINCIGRLLLFVSAMAFSESFITLISLAMTGEMPYTLSAVLYLNFIVIPICGFSILLQNRNTNQSISKIDYTYISKASMKNSLMVSAVYFFMLALANKFETPSFENISFMIFAIYGNIFSLKLLYKKHYWENKLSYNLIILNLLLQIPLMIYLVR